MGPAGSGVSSPGNFFPNLLIVCGSGRDTGKTQLACNIIDRWKDSESILAIKISMHRHEKIAPMERITWGEGFSVWKEISFTAKDTGRFLQAGAQKVLYIETTDAFLRDAFLAAIELAGNYSVIICESGGLARLIRPGVLLYVQSGLKEPDDNKKQVRDLADRIIFSGSGEMLHPERFLTIAGHEWRLIS